MILKLRSLIFILLVLPLAANATFEASELDLIDPNFSEFEFESLNLLKNQNTQISLERLIDILDKNYPATKYEEEELLKIVELAAFENVQSNYNQIEILQREIRSYRHEIIGIPLILFAAGWVINFDVFQMEWSTLFKVFYDTMGAAIVWNYLPELRETSRSHTQQMKKDLACKVLLAKIQIWLFRKKEGFPWPFSDNPTCEQVLSLNLKEIKIK